MKIYQSIQEFPSEIMTIITIGTFDGVHKGHQKIISRINAIGKKEGLESLLVTFHPHPRHVLFDDTYDFQKYKDKYVKLVVINKKDLFQFDRFTDKLLTVGCHDVKIVEDFSEMDASNVSDDIIENAEDTMTLLERYIDELPVDLSKDRLKNTMRTLYTEAQDLEI